jgi:hypothetical protein
VRNAGSSRGRNGESHGGVGDVHNGITSVDLGILSTGVAALFAQIFWKRTSMSGTQLVFSLPTVVVVTIASIALALSFLFYRHTLPVVTSKKRILLIFLRAAALSLLAVLLLEPVLRLVTSSAVIPSLAVLVDNSQSMRITDRTINRAAELKRLGQSEMLHHVEGRAALHYYTFGTRLRTHASITHDTLALDEQTTDIASALRALSREHEQTPFNAVLLISDGSYNLGHNPVYEAERIGLPFYTVGIGDSSEQKDVVLTRVAVNEVVYGDAPAPVDATIKSSGYSGMRAVVSLQEGSRELDHATAILSEGTREYPIHLSYVPQGEGLKRLSVAVAPLPGELTTSNNQRSFFVRVLKTRLHVVLIAGSPSPDLTVIRQTLLEQNKFSIHTFTQRQASGFYEGPLLQPVLDSADCLILVGFPTSGTSGSTLQSIQNSVLRDHKPFLFVNGRNVDLVRLQALGSVLPFTADLTSTTEQSVSFEPAEKQRDHPLVQLDRSGGSEAWKKLPPLFRTMSTYHAKPEAITLGYAALQGVVLPDPLVLVRSINRQKCVALLGYGIWRWRLMAQGSPQTEDLLTTFLSRTLQWLAAPDDTKPVRISTGKETYRQGEPVEFSGQVYDAQSRPVDNALVRITTMQGMETFETDLRSIGSGRYEGILGGLGEGEYSFRGTARSGETEIGDDRGHFTVGGLNLEFQDTRMNAPLMRELAYRTGGKFFPSSESDTLETALFAQSFFAPHEHVSSTTLELWHLLYVPGVIVLLLTIEWTIRKRSGML